MHATTYTIEAKGGIVGHESGAAGHHWDGHEWLDSKRNKTHYIETHDAQYELKRAQDAWPEAKAEIITHQHGEEE